MPRLRRALPLFLTLALLGPGGFAAPALAERPECKTRLDISGGVHVPLDSDSRDAWGVGQAFHVGLSARQTDSNWLGVDLGLVHTAGLETNYDPTFELGDTNYWLVPITFSVRWGAGHTASGDTPLYLGVGFQTWLTWYDPPAGRTRSGVALGFMGEWRYEIRLQDAAALFLRQRIVFTSSQSYGGFAPETGFSSTLLELGLSRRLR